MKVIDKFSEIMFLVDIPQNRPVIVDTATIQEKVDSPPHQDSDKSKEQPVVDDDDDEDLIEEIEEEIDDEETSTDEVTPKNDVSIADKIILQTFKQEVIDDKAEGFDIPSNNPYGLFAIVLSVPRTLLIQFGSEIPFRIYLPVLKITSELSQTDTCCVNDLPVHLTYNGILIYTGDSSSQPAFAAQEKTSNSKEGECNDCCCDVPPEPTPNYCFTYTNCDGEAYIDLYIKQRTECEEEPSEQVRLSSSECNTCYETVHYQISFFPGLEPECGCDIVSAISNVLKADSIDDFVDPYITGQFFDFGDNEQSGFQPFGYDRLEYTTHFEDACGVCWSLVYFSGNNTLIEEYSSNYYLIPICASPVEFDTFCYYEKYLSDREFPNGATGSLYEYINDGEYRYQSNYTPSGGGSTDYYQIDINVEIAFIEFMGNSLLAFSFDQYIASEYQGDYGDGDNYVTLLVDLPDTMGYDSAYIDDFILCSEAYFEFFFGYIVKNSGDIFDDIRTDDFLSDENALILAKLVLATYAENVDSLSFPSFPLSEGVLEDNLNNVYGLQYSGGSVTTTLFDGTPFNTDGVYLTNVALASGSEVGINNTDLEICYCGDSLIQRFEEFQAATGCDSDYSDPRTYIDKYVNAHFVEEGDHRYLEINYAVPVYEACSGYSEGTYETFRVCIDDEISIDKLCINAEELFNNYYNYGYVNFENLLYQDDAVFFKNDEGDCYVIADENSYEEQSYVNCDYELAPCECEESIDNGKSINDVEDISVSGNQIYINNNEYSQYYYLNFYFIHDENGSKVKIDYTYSGGGSDTTYSEEFLITGGDVDCCCKLESFIVDESDLNEFVNAYLYRNDGQYLYLEDFIYYFSEEGNFNFYDCDNNCFDFFTTYEGVNNPTTFAIEPCDEEACCKHDIAVQYTPQPDPDPEPEVDLQILAESSSEENCFDQYFDFDYVSCNDLNYIELTWYYNNDVSNDCFNFPIHSNSVLISIPDDLLAVSCECPITQLIIPEESEHDYSQYFQDCCTLSDNNNSETGYTLLDNLACDLAVFVSECNENFVVTRDDNNNYNLVGIGENYIRTTTLDDENAFGAGYTYINFTADYEFALDEGEGLSLREAVILNNQYDAEVDSILLQSGTYNLTRLGAGEGLSDTGDLDVLNELAIIGACDSVIDGQYADRIFQNHLETTLTLRNLTLQNGLTDADSGAGVFLNESANLALYNTDIINCVADAGSGGGIYAAFLNEISLNDSSVSSSSGDYGGGIYIAEGNLVSNGNSSIDNNFATFAGGGIYDNGQSLIILNDNTAVSSNRSDNANDSGGGIFAYLSTIELHDDSKIDYNTAAGKGGGISDVGSSAIRLYDKSNISNNTSETVGGGIAGSQTTITLNGASHITDNSAVRGGGIHFSSSSLILYGASQIDNNTATVYGGGVFDTGYSSIDLTENSSIKQNKTTDTSFGSGGGIFSQFTSIQLFDDSTIAENTSSLYGGGIYDNSTSFIELNNTSSIADNTAVSFGGGIITYKSTMDVYNGSRITGNSSGFAGGGIGDFGLSTITFNGFGTLANNNSTYGGGLITNGGSTIVLNDSYTVANNTALEGAGIHLSLSNLILNVDSQIASNEADGSGGGVYLYYATITLNDSSLITQNVADADNNTFGEGGGIYNFNGDGTINLFGGTVTGNTLGNGSTSNIFPPLVLDLNHDGNIQLTSLENSSVSWDLKGDGNLLKTGWVGPEDGLLVYDKAGDGFVTDISEFMLTLYHPDAKTDMDGLKLAFDSNHDLVFDIKDDHYREFGVWQDINGDGITDLGEYSSLLDRGIESISLVSDNNASIQEGNRIFGSSTYKITDGSEYRIADVGLSVESKASLDINDVIQPQNSLALESTSASAAPNVVLAQADCVICLAPLPVAQIQEEPQPVFA